jgi:cardiolipin synthase
MVSLRCNWLPFRLQTRHRPMLLRHLPNVLTTLRLAAAPATAGLLAQGHFNAAFGLFALAGLSDAADGFLAKRFGLSSRLGRFLDPVADKALMLAVFVTLAILDDVPMWLAATVILRDLLIVTGLTVAVASGAPISIKPLMAGKICTATQVAYVALHLGSHAFGFSIASIYPADGYITAGVALASAVAYFMVWLNAMQSLGRKDFA